MARETVLRQQVYEQIKHDIITCKLAPGEPLSENQFLDRFQVSKTPIRVEDKWVIVGLAKKTDADMTGLLAQRDTLKQSMMSERQDQVFEDYIAGVQQRMKRDGKIKIYNDVLAQLEDSEPAAEPNFPGGFEFPTK